MMAWDFCFFKQTADFCAAVTVGGKVEDFFHDPHIIGVGYQTSLLVGGFDISDGRIGTVMRTIHEFGVQCRFDFLRGLSCVHLV